MGYTNYAAKNFEIVTDRNRDREIPGYTNPCEWSAVYYSETAYYQKTINSQSIRFSQKDLKW